jgi:hypothetical protein
MKAQDLRIGNCISDIHASKTFIGFVSEIRKDKIYYNGFVSKIQDIKPIELSEEILLKCGYKSIRENHYGVLGHLIWNIEDRFYCDKNGIQLKYLHQLQNLYFALTNEELTINL